MKASAKRFLSLLISLGLLLVAILIFTLLLRPAYREVNQLRGELASKSETLESQEKIVMQAKSLLAQYESDLATLKNSISLAMPIGEDYPALVNQLNSLSKAFGLVLVATDLNALPISPASGINRNLPTRGTIQMKIQLKGTYQGFKSFLNALETNIRLMDVVSFTITPEGQSQNFSYFTVVNTYYQVP